jgi:hypothetical protein
MLAADRSMFQEGLAELPGSHEDKAVGSACGLPEQFARRLLRAAEVAEVDPFRYAVLRMYHQLRREPEEVVSL